MGIWRTSTAVIVGIVVGIVGFMIYHKQTTLPMADLLNAPTQSIGWALSYQINESSLVISNNSTALSGLLTLTIAYDPSSITFMTWGISSNYDYSYDLTRVGSITLFIEWNIQWGQIISLPLQWESSNLSITSPSLKAGDTVKSLSITRIE